MTQPLAGSYLAKKLEANLPGTVLHWNDQDLWVSPESVLKVCQFLTKDPELSFDFLVSITGVDYIEYFEVVYHLTSMRHNHSAVLKARCHTRVDPTVPSVVSVWQGADLQEREVYDLMGIAFAGHPNLKRVFLWEGFQGHPLRKDYL